MERTNFRKRIVIFCLILLALLLSSCNATISLNNPCVITNAFVFVGAEKNQHKFAGAYVDVVNCSNQTIESAELSFLVYDSKGKPIHGVGNKVSVQVQLDLLKNEETEIIVSLDELVGTNLDSSYSLDFVHFTRINFEDGTYWIDPLGVTTKW